MSIKRHIAEQFELPLQAGDDLAYAFQERLGILYPDGNETPEQREAVWQECFWAKMSESNL